MQTAPYSQRVLRPLGTESLVVHDQFEDVTFEWVAFLLGRSSGSNLSLEIG
jgi:hypothetical protein